MKKQIDVLLLMLLIAVNCVAQNKSKYEVAGKISLSGNAGWDYLTMEPASGRMFVSHGTMVQVVDVKSAKILGTINDLKGVHGIALAKEFNKGFITNGKDSSVTVFDLTTYAVLGKVKITGANPDAILFDAFSKKVFVYNGKTADATVLDASNNSIIATIPLDGKPEFSVTDGNGKVFVNIEDKSEITEINSSTLKVVHTWSVKPGEEPSGLAIDTMTHRLFTVCDNKLLVVVNAENGKIITTLPIGSGVDGVAFDNGLKRIYSSNGEGNLTIIQEEKNDQYKVLETLVTQKGGRTITLDETTHHIYIPTAEFEETTPKTAENPHPRPSLKPGTFVVLDIKAE